jgi:hypothetical protein
VSDQTGGVIPGSNVTVHNEGTSLTLSTVSGADGSYTFTPIKIGTYTVSVEARGFQKATREHLTVNVQQQVVVNFTLQPGQVTETVTVNAAPPSADPECLCRPSRGRRASQ